MSDIASDLENQGFALVPAIAAPHDLASLKAVFEGGDMARAERGGQTYGARNLLGLVEVQKFAVSPKLGAHLNALLGEGFKTVRGIFFDKTEGANWPVLWHQDLSLAVKERREISGWTNWSVKRGVQHVQAPAAALEKMVTIRLHLDDCPAENGPLRVVPGSHRYGLLSRGTIQHVVARQESQTIVASCGDALFMRPLILHASSPAQAPHHRRVLHLEFAPAKLLPAGLDWAEAI